jgi:hypothetical protein
MVFKPYLVLIRMVVEGTEKMNIELAGEQATFLADIYVHLIWRDNKPGS